MTVATQFLLQKIKTALAEKIFNLSLQLNPEKFLWIERMGVPVGMQGERFKFMEDGLACIHACDFLQKDDFINSYRSGADTGSWNGWNLRWRVRVVLWAAAWASKIRGDFVECGVYKGGLTEAILNYLNFPSLGKNYHLFDTFNGFDTRLLHSHEEKVANHYQYKNCYDDVKKRFGSLPFINIVRGSVPDTLQQAAISEVALLSIDLNCVEPEIAAADHFWPMLTAGGLIILDDYGFSLHRAQKDAFDIWAAAHGVEILELPTGQGLIIKPFIPN